MPEETKDETRLGIADPSSEINPEGEASTPASANDAPEPKVNGTPEPEPFHKNPRFQELVSEKNYWRQEAERLHSELAGDRKQTPQADPVEKIVKRYVQAGMKEDAARLIAQGQVDLNREVVQKEVAPLRDAALRQQHQLTFAQFRETHKDMDTHMPKMQEVYRNMSTEDQEWVAKSARGIQYLYDQAKAENRDAEVKEAFNKGVQEGKKNKLEKTAIAPSTGASTGQPKGSYSEKDISDMTLEEYAAHRKEILASRGVR